MQIRRWTKFLAAAAVLAGTSNAEAAPLTFDCDARPNANASVSNNAQNRPSVSGTITAKKFQEGRVQPTVGASIAAMDNSSFASVRLQAVSNAATELSILFNTNVLGVRENFTLGTVPANVPISFRLFTDDQGLVRLFVNDQSWEADFTDLAIGKEATFCSTGQFEFSNLRFSD